MTTRRQFLTSVGVGALAAITGGPTLAAPAMPLPRRKGKPPAFFTPILPSSEDALIVPPEFKCQVVIKWGDPLGSKAPDGSPEHFGFNCDFNAFFPIDALDGKSNPDEGLLWTNHEYPHPLFLNKFPAMPKEGTPQHDDWAARVKTAAEIMVEKLAVGGSVTHLKRAGGTWTPVVPSKYNRRFTAAYPEITFSGPAAGHLTSGLGTLGNCSGGRTPWHTVLTCEENYPDYNGRGRFEYRWGDVPALKLDETKYGWVVEVDPFGVLPPHKLSALGRFKHENAACRCEPGKPFVVYMGDDEVDQHFYKFVSAEKWSGSGDRAEQRKLLEAGTLYAADMAAGKWIPLELTPDARKKIKASPDYKDAVAKDSTVRVEKSADMLIHARLCARILGATPLDRCEDCEVHPKDKSVYVAMSNNTKHGNLYGHIVRLVEDGDDAAATTFTYEVFLAGGPQTGVAAPDNLAFDPHGNLWVVCDLSGDKVNTGAYKPFKNNGLFVVPTEGDSAGDAFQFASGPVQAELTGPWFSDDGSTLFLSVQHPGEETTDLNAPTSRWPSGLKTEPPRPSVVAITGFKR